MTNSRDRNLGANESIGLSDKFNAAAHAKISEQNAAHLDQHHEKNKELDAMDGESMHIPRADTYAFAAKTKLKREQVEKKMNREFSVILTMINSFQTLIEANFDAIDNVIVNLHELIDTALTGMSDILSEIENIQHDHRHFQDWIESRGGKHTLGSIEANEGAQRLYERYCKRTSHTATPNDDYLFILRNQMLYERDVYIPLQEDRMRDLGDVYNDTINAVDEMGLQKLELEEDYDDIRSMDNNQLKVEELDKLETKTKNLIDQSNRSAKILQEQLDQAIGNDEDISDDLKCDVSEAIVDIQFLGIQSKAPSPM